MLSRIVDIALWIGVAVALFLAFGRRDRGPQLGTEVHSLSLPLADGGKSVRVPGNLERPLLIKAFASWCGACRRAALYDDPTQARQSGKLDVIGISVDDDIQEARSAKRDWGIVYPVAHDQRGEFARRYQVSILPTYILIGTDGRVHRVTSGIPGPLDFRAWGGAE